MRAQTDLTVIVNVYNGHKYIQRCVDVICAQTLLPSNILIVDNCSTDGTYERAASMRNEVLNINIVKTPRHMPLYAARNFAIKTVETKYTAFCDVDDYWLPTKLTHQIKTLDDENVDLVASNFLQEMESDDSPSENLLVYRKLPRRPHPHSHFFKPYIHFSSIVGKTSVFNEIGFDEDLTILGDADFLFRAAEQFKLCIIPSFDTFYTYHDNNTGANRFSEVSVEFAHLSEKYAETNHSLSRLLASYGQYLAERLSGKSIFVSLLQTNIIDIFRTSLQKRFLL